MENIEGKYFIDENKYNCPFCKNRGIKYVVLGIVKFNEKATKEMYAVFVECSYCHNVSMHLIKNDEFDSSFKMNHYESCNFYILNSNCSELTTYTKYQYNANYFGLINTYKNSNSQDLPICNDENIILHIPTSFFTTDNRIPKKLRELINEAEKCIQNNCMTGASACIRKTIYEFLLDQNAQGQSYNDKIKSLKNRYKTLDNAYIDMISGIQGIMCDQVHEKSVYESFKSNEAKVYIEILKEIFNSVYVIPQETNDRKQEINKLYSQISNSRNNK